MPSDDGLTVGVAPFRLAGPPAPTPRTTGSSGRCACPPGLLTAAWILVARPCTAPCAAGRSAFVPIGAARVPVPGSDVGEFPAKDAPAFAAEVPPELEDARSAPVPPAGGEPLPAPRSWIPAVFIVCAAAGAPKPFAAGAVRVSAGAAIAVLMPFAPLVEVVVTVPTTGPPFPVPSPPVLIGAEPSTVTGTWIPRDEVFPLAAAFPLPSLPAPEPPAAVEVMEGDAVGSGAESPDRSA